MRPFNTSLTAMSDVRYFANDDYVWRVNTDSREVVRRRRLGVRWRRWWGSFSDFISAHGPIRGDDGAKEIPKEEGEPNPPPRKRSGRKPGKVIGRVRYYRLIDPREEMWLSKAFTRKAEAKKYRDDNLPKWKVVYRECITREAE